MIRAKSILEKINGSILRIPKIPAVSAVACAFALAGCASNHVQREPKVSPQVYAAGPSRPSSKSRVHQRGRQLAMQPAPNCKFNEFDNLKPVDPDRWKRLKLEYVRRCHRHEHRILRARLPQSPA
jgi:hypothetical protein